MPDYRHPANQYPAIMNYYGLMGIYRESLKKKAVTLNIDKWAVAPRRDSPLRFPTAGPADQSPRFM